MYIFAFVNSLIKYLKVQSLFLNMEYIKCCNIVFYKSNSGRPINVSALSYGP